MNLVKYDPIIETINPDTGQLGFVSQSELFPDANRDKYTTFWIQFRTGEEFGMHTNGGGLAANIEIELITDDSPPSSD